MYPGPYPGWSPREHSSKEPNTDHNDRPPFFQETAMTMPSGWLHSRHCTAPNCTPVSIKNYVQHSSFTQAQNKQQYIYWIQYKQTKSTSFQCTGFRIKPNTPGNCLLVNCNVWDKLHTPLVSSTPNTSTVPLQANIQDLNNTNHNHNHSHYKGQTIHVWPTFLFQRLGADI